MKDSLTVKESSKNEVQEKYLGLHTLPISQVKTLLLKQKAEQTRVSPLDGNFSKDIYAR